MSSAESRPPVPDVFAYLDHRAFLADWFAWKQDRNPRFSHRAFSRAAGSKNPSLLLLVTQSKRNLTANTLPGVLKALKLSDEEAAFFRLLVELDQAPDDETRTALVEQISATTRFRQARRLEAEGFAYLSHWYVPAVRELAATAGFCHDPVWVAEHLRPQIPVEDARKALELLETLGMVVPDGEGGATVAEGSLVTPHEVTRLAVLNYHRGMLRLAGESMTRFPQELRHLGAVTASVPAARLAQLKEEVARFQERILDLCDRDPDPADLVVQLNLQLFPLSQAPSQETP